MNEGTRVIVNLMGGIALLLWGVRMVRTGVLRAWGDSLKHFIEVRLGNRPSAFLAGASATAILGSGTATTLIVAGIAASGAIGTSLGLAVLLGADVGSAIVSTLFASGSSLALWASPILIFAGHVTFSATREFRPRNIGRIMIGVGLMLMSLKLISTATVPLRDASLFHQVLTAIGREPTLAFLSGAIMAWAFHSSLAVILLIASFVANGSLELAGALAFILGLNLGSGLPAITSTLALPPAGRRLPVANLMCRGLAAIVGIAFIARISSFSALMPFNAVNVALAFHALFNLGVGLVFLPLTRLVEKQALKMVPDEKLDSDQLAAPRYLDAQSLTSPSIALSNALFETVRMSEVLNRMFDTALSALRLKSTETLKLLKPLDERLNTFQNAIQSYLVDLTQTQLTSQEARRALEVTLYVSNLEHAGDVIQLNLADRVKAKAKENIEFSMGEQAAFDDLCLIIHDNIRLATGVLSSGDVDGARRLIAQKDAFRKLENSVLDQHFKSDKQSKRGALRRSALYVDMIRDLHRINSHIVSAGYPIVEAAGLLRGSRLRSDAENNS